MPSKLYRVTKGATNTQIPRELGTIDATLSTWLKPPVVPVSGRHVGVPRDPGGDELARSRVENQLPHGREKRLTTEKHIVRTAAKTSPTGRGGEPPSVRRRPPGHLSR